MSDSEARLREITLQQTQSGFRSRREYVEQINDLLLMIAERDRGLRAHTYVVGSLEREVVELRTRLKAANLPWQV